MPGIYKSIDELIGNTPLLELTNTEKSRGLKARILAKLEYFNPAGSAKDRIAKAMIDSALESGKYGDKPVIIEPTSGNTGIGLACVAAARGLRAIIVMPDTMSIERRLLMKAYGAEVVLTPGSEGMSGALKKAEELKSEIPGSIIAGQFSNPVNPQAHFETTGPEIYADTEGRADYFVAGIGTGGTVTGAGRFLKSKIPGIKIIGVEPASSPLITGGKAGAHKIQGIGANFIPEVFDGSVCDGIFTVKDEDAYECAREIGKNEGILVGISSGAALSAAFKLAEKEENAGKTIVVLLPDTGERYLSTPDFIK